MIISNLRRGGVKQQKQTTEIITRNDDLQPTPSNSSCLQQLLWSFFQLPVPTLHSLIIVCTKHQEQLSRETRDTEPTRQKRTLPCAPVPKVTSSTTASKYTYGTVHVQIRKVRGGWCRWWGFGGGGKELLTNWSKG